MPAPKILYILADGTRARLVRRVPGTSHFTTFEQFDDGGDLRQAQAAMRGAPHPVTFQSGTPQGHSIGRGEEDRRVKAAFAAKVAARAAEVAQAQGYDRVVITAPTRLAAILREQASRGTTVAAVLARDLTKTPDAALSRWLLDVVLP